MKYSTILTQILTLTYINAQGLRCRTPTGVDGECINIRKCPALLTLLTIQMTNAETRNFLLQSVCNYDGISLVVCCVQSRRNSTSRMFSITSTSVITDLPQITSESFFTNQLLSPPHCGKSNSSESRIVGGVPALKGQFPWIVALGYRNRYNPNLPQWLCGGSLITYTHVLTAGHCVSGKKNLYLVRVGELDLFSDEDDADPEDILITNIKLHEAYDSTYVNDIAILTLAHKPIITGVWPICLPTKPLQSKDSPFVAGWGAIYFRGPASSILQVIQLPIVSDSKCKQAFSRFKQQVIDDRVLCAGDIEGRKSSCQGDSGGPLMLSEKIDEDKYVFYEIGIVSYSLRCAEPDYPTVYTKISSFLDWIRSNIK